MSASLGASTGPIAGQSRANQPTAHPIDVLLDPAPVDRKVSKEILDRFTDRAARAWLKKQIVAWRQNVADQQAFEKLHGASKPAKVQSDPAPSVQAPLDQEPPAQEPDQAPDATTNPVRADNGPPESSKALPEQAPQEAEPDLSRPSEQPSPDEPPLKKQRTSLPRRAKMKPNPAKATSARDPPAQQKEDKTKPRQQPPADKSPEDVKDSSQATRWLRFFTKPATANARLDELECCINLAIKAGCARELEIDDLQGFVFKYFSSVGMGRLIDLTESELADLGCEEASNGPSFFGARHPADPLPAGAEEKEYTVPSNTTYCDFKAELVLNDSHWYASLIRDYAPAVQQAHSDPNTVRSLGVLQVHQCVHLDGVQLSDRSSTSSSGWSGNGPTAKQCHAEMESILALGLCGGEMINATDARRDCAGPAIRLAERAQSGHTAEGKTVFAHPAQQRLDRLELKLFFGFLYARYGLRLRGAIAKGAEASVALDIAPFGHSLLLDPDCMVYPSHLFGYDLPVYAERHAKFVALTTKTFYRSLLLLKTALHYVDLQQKYLRENGEQALPTAARLGEEIYDALSGAVNGTTLRFSDLRIRLEFLDSSTINEIFACVTKAEKAIRGWAFPEWMKVQETAPLEGTVEPNKFSAVRADSPLADLISAAKTEKKGGGLIAWSDLPPRAQQFVLATFQLVDPTRSAPKGLISVREILSEFGSITHRNGVFGQTSNTRMDQLYALPSNLKDHLHQKATTLGGTLSANAISRNWLEEAHEYLRYEAVLHLAESTSAYRSTRLWLQAMNEALPEGEKIMRGARRMQGPKSDKRTLGSFGPLQSLTDFDSVMTPVGNSFIELLRSKGLVMKVVETIFGSKARADRFKATVWAELVGKMDATWDMARLYSVMNMGGLCTYNCVAARRANPNLPHITDTRYWFKKPEGQDRNWSFVHVLNGALLDKIIYFEPIPNMQLEYPPLDEIRPSTA